MRGMWIIITMAVITRGLWDDRSYAQNNRYAIYENHKAGYIDSLGNVAIAPQFDEASGLSEGLAWVEIGAKHYAITVTDTADISSRINPEQIDSMHNEGYIIYSTRGKRGFIDIKGSVIITPQFDDVSDFSEGLAAVNIGAYWNDDGTIEGGKYGFIDRNGKIVIPLKFDYAADFSEGLAGVDSAGKRGFINHEGVAVIPLQYAGVEPFSYGIAICRTDFEGGYKFIDKNGNFVDGGRYYSESCLIARVDDKYGVFDSTEKELISPRYEDPGPFVEGKAGVKFNGKWGFINHIGEFVFEPIYDAVGNYSSGMAAVRSEGAWGYVDAAGKMTITPQFFHAEPFHGGLAKVEGHGMPCPYGNFGVGFGDPTPHEIT